MGRTIPSFRIALEMEERRWKPFRNALDKSDRKKFDEMMLIFVGITFHLALMYCSALSKKSHKLI
jgi:hypothetical protein